MIKTASEMTHRCGFKKKGAFQAHKKGQPVEWEVYEDHQD